MSRQGITYIRANRKNGTLYIGSTAWMLQRHHQHDTGQGSQFVKKYKLDRLVYYEVHESAEQAFHREHQLKKWRRDWELKLIHDFNPYWLDLLPTLKRMGMDELA